MRRHDIELLTHDVFAFEVGCTLIQASSARITSSYGVSWPQIEYEPMVSVRDGTHLV